MPSIQVFAIVTVLAMRAFAGERGVEQDDRLAFGAVALGGGLALMGLSFVPDLAFSSPENDAPFMIPTVASMLLVGGDVLLAEAFGRESSCVWNVMAWLVGAGAGLLTARAMHDGRAPVSSPIPWLVGTAVMQLGVTLYPFESDRSHTTAIHSP